MTEVTVGLKVNPFLGPTNLGDRVPFQEPKSLPVLNLSHQHEVSEEYQPEEPFVLVTAGSNLSPNAAPPSPQPQSKLY